MPIYLFTSHAQSIVNVVLTQSSVITKDNDFNRVNTSVNSTLVRIKQIVHQFNEMCS